jgi:hypothetical protein
MRSSNLSRWTRTFAGSLNFANEYALAKRWAFDHCRGGLSAGVLVDEMINAVQPNKPDDDKVKGNDVVQQSWQNQDQDASDEGNERRNVCGSDNHGDLVVVE